MSPHQRWSLKQAVCILLEYILVTAHKQSLRRLFSQMSVHRGGCLPHCMLGYTPPRSRHPPRADTTPGNRHPPGSRHPPPPRSRHPPQEQTPRNRPGVCSGGDPPGADTPRSACWEIRAARGRYASYWNAYLCNVFVHKK